MSRFLVGLLLFLFAQSTVDAQVDLRPDKQFFEQQAEEYGDWLDQQGYGQFIKVQEMGVFKEYVVLNLTFRSSNVETIVGEWTALKQAFEEKSPLLLEEKLFYQAATMFELQDTMLAVGLYDNFDPLKIKVSTFSREMLFIDGKVSVSEEDPKASITPIKLFPKGIKSGALSSVLNFQQNVTREAVYTCISTYLSDRFSEAGYQGTAPEIIVREKKENLRVEVVNLRKEVLAQTSLCGWLEAFGFDCRWAKRETLTFLFAYEQTSNGIQLTGDISGKVGSGGFFQEPRGSYRNMEPHFEEELLSYIEKITAEVTNQLDKCNE